MALPLLFVILTALAVLALSCAGYLLLYRRRANRVLSGGAAGRPMRPPHTAAAALAVLVLSAAVAASYFAGYKAAYDRMEAGSSAPVPETFYGEITDISGTPEAGNAVTVRGLAVNDPRYRGNFSFAVYGETSIERQGRPASFADLDEGDAVAVTFTGAPEPSDPAVLAHVVRVQILEDAL